MLRVRLDYTRKGMRHFSEICRKYGLDPHITLNGWWDYEMTENQYKSLEMAEKNGYLRRILI